MQQVFAPIWKNADASCIERESREVIGILSDAHGNKPGFDRAIEVLETYGAKTFIFLGDALGYLPTAGVLQSIVSLGSRILCVRGNHEDLLLRDRFETQREPVYQHRRIRKLMTPEELKLIAGWSRWLCLEFTAGNAIFVHGSPVDPTWGCVYPDSDLSQFNIKQRFVFMGHTHRPFIRTQSNATFVNVGSCGLPRDHGRLGSAALFDDATGGITLIRFDIQDQTRQALETAHPVHWSVLELSHRQPDSYEGDLIGK